MDIEYVKEGYALMMEYMREEKILTRERKFRRKLDKIYEEYKDKDWLDVEEELEYLKLEKYFFNNIISPRNSSEEALTNFLNIITSIDKIE